MHLKRILLFVFKESAFQKLQYVFPNHVASRSIQIIYIAKNLMCFVIFKYSSYITKMFKALEMVLWKCLITSRYYMFLNDNNFYFWKHLQYFVYNPFFPEFCFPGKFLLIFYSVKGLFLQLQTYTHHPDQGIENIDSAPECSVMLLLNQYLLCSKVITILTYIIIDYFCPFLNLIEMEPYSMCSCVDVCFAQHCVCEIYP